jgi:hypothetical protein
MKQSKLSTILDISTLILLYFIFLCAIIADKYTIMSNYIFENTFSNFDIDPIVDIEISRWRCQDGFYPLFNFSYPGYDSACYNKTSKDYTPNSNKHFCKKDENFLNKVDKTPMIGWREKVICIKRESFKNDSYISPSNDTCKEDYKFCGYADSFKDKFCVKNERDCPIFFFEINKTNIYKNDNNISSHSLDKFNSLFYSNNSTEILEKGPTIKIDFSIASEFPCIIKERISPIGKLFPLMLKESLKYYGCRSPENFKNKFSNKLNNSDSDLYFDTRYESIDSYELLSFNNDNDMEILNSLPDLGDYTLDKNIKIKLYSRPYIYPNFKCQVNSLDFFDIVKIYKEVKLDNFLLNIYILGNLVILCIFISIISLMKITSKSQNLILSLFKILSCFLLCYLICNQAFSIKDKDDKLNSLYFSLSENNCLDEVTKTTLKNIFYTIETFNFKSKLIDIIYYSLFFYLGFILIQFLKFCHKLYLRYLKKRNSVTSKKDKK